MSPSAPTPLHRRNFAMKRGRWESLDDVDIVSVDSEDIAGLTVVPTAGFSHLWVRAQMVWAQHRGSWWCWWWGWWWRWDSDAEQWTW